MGASTKIFITLHFFVTNRFRRTQWWRAKVSERPANRVATTLTQTALLRLLKEMNR